MGDLGLWEGSVWVWDLRWRRPLFVRETVLLNEMLKVVSRLSRVDMEDVWSWTHSVDGRQSVKSDYTYIIKGLSATSAP